MNENPAYKSGFATLIGRPNVGKSTLMNRLIGQKIAITSNKPQTTRNRIQTVYTCEDGQIVFLDTPGIHKAKNKLGEYMVQVAERTLKDVDVILWLVEPTTFIGAGERHIAEQLKGRIHTIGKTAQGIRRFILGLGKKILIANLLGELCSIFRASDDKSVLFFWLYAVAYTLHVYFDFSGYSDMAIGLGKLFGFDFLENFNYPFISKSITEFWRRWHMSLGTWFRDYVYIPLGGSCVSLPRHLFNIFLVWMLTGFWHGAAWNFVIWGLYFALLLILEKIWLLEILKKSHVLNRIYVLTAAVISFVIFDATDMSQAFSYLKAMFGTGGYPLTSAASSYYFRSYFVVLMIALLGATPIPKSFCRRIQQWKTGTAVMLFAEPLALSALLLICTAFLVDGSFNPFLYFRF